MLHRPAPLEPFRHHSATTYHYPATLTPPIYAEDRPFFHSGHEIPRPLSAAPFSHTPHYQVPQRSFSGPHTLQLPGLATLASLAAASVPAYERSVDMHESLARGLLPSCS